MIKYYLWASQRVPLGVGAPRPAVVLSSPCLKDNSNPFPESPFRFDLPTHTCAHTQLLMNMHVWTLVASDCYFPLGYRTVDVEIFTFSVEAPPLDLSSTFSAKTHRNSRMCLPQSDSLFTPKHLVKGSHVCFLPCDKAAPTAVGDPQDSAFRGAEFATCASSTLETKGCVLKPHVEHRSAAGLMFFSGGFFFFFLSHFPDGLDLFGHWLFQIPCVIKKKIVFFLLSCLQCG